MNQLRNSTFYIKSVDSWHYKFAEFVNQEFLSDNKEKLPKAKLPGPVFHQRLSQFLFTEGSFNFPLTKWENPWMVCFSFYRRFKVPEEFPFCLAPGLRWRSSSYLALQQWNQTQLVQQVGWEVGGSEACQRPSPASLWQHSKWWHLPHVKVSTVNDAKMGQKSQEWLPGDPQCLLRAVMDFTFVIDVIARGWKEFALFCPSLENGGWFVFEVSRL